MLRYIAGLLAILLSCTPLAAQDWPERQVTIIVPFIAGSTPDSLARIVAESLQQRLGQPFVVENRPGASGNTGTAAAAKAAPDGHTLGVSIVGPLVINHLLFAKMPYDTAKDIAPISILAAQPSVLAIAPNVAADSVESLLAAIKREPDKFTYGSIGRGSLSHLAMASLAMKAGVKVVHLPFQGSPAAVTALLRGDVQMAVLPAASVAPLAARGQAEAAGGDLAAALAAVSRPADAAGSRHRRRRGRRLGRPDRARPARSEAILGKIHKEVAAVLAEPAVVDKLKAQFMVPIASSPEAFRAVLKEEHDRWAPIIAAAGMKPE